MSKTIFSGLEDSGKSYQLAITAGWLAERNSRWLKKTGVARPIVSNLKFETWFEEYVEKELGIPILYWHNLEDLPTMKDLDLIIDEVGAYFDSRTFSDLPLEVRLWLAQASKLGVQIYGSAQDFAQVDLSFRRLTTSLVHITKIMGSPRPSKTKPPVKFIWGICSMRELDPMGYKEDEKKFTASGILPKFFFIRKEYCKIFDTNRRVAKSKPVPYKHIERRCELKDCAFHKLSHV